MGNLDAFVDWCGVPLVGADTTACTTGSAKQLQRPTMRRDETNQTAYDGLSKIETMLALPDHTAGLLQCNESIVCSHEHHGIDIDEWIEEGGNARSWCVVRLGMPSVSETGLGMCILSVGLLVGHDGD